MGAYVCIWLIQKVAAIMESSVVLCEGAEMCIGIAKNHG